MTHYPTSRLRTVHLLALAAVLALGTALPATAAGVSALDEWDRSGTVSLGNGAQSLVFSKADGCGRVYGLSAGNKVEVMSLVPLGANDERATGIVSCKVTGSSSDGATCEVRFSTRTQPIEASFVFSRAGAIQVRPSESLRALSVSAAFAYGVLPSRQLDDNVYAADGYPELARLHIPSENLFVGLLEGNNRIVVCAWPSGEQSVSLVLDGPAGNRGIEALELNLAGREAFLGAFAAPGIWHEVTLGPAYEEQENALDWKPPFPAAWRTQLTELGVPTAFRLLPSRERPWRPTVGYYNYPLFLEGGKVLLSLHKKLECEGRALIYALEGHEKTPYAFLTANLGAQEQRRIVELHPVLSDYALDPSFATSSLVMNSHCAGRDQLKYTTLTVGAQAREIAFLDTHIDDRARECGVIATHSVERSLRCMDELDKQINAWLTADRDSPAVASFLQGLKGSLATMQQEYRERLDGRSPDAIRRHIAEVARDFKATIREGAGRELCPEILFYINELNAIISLEEDATRRFGTAGRGLFQEAGYTCVGDPRAAKLAVEVRSRLREQMRYRYAETPNGQDYPEGLLSGG
jgi:hypothetical protein